jgi:predicted ATP-dependent serine protease
LFHDAGQPAGSRYRTLRGHKNRFGAVNELGIFAMTGSGHERSGESVRHLPAARVMWIPQEV